MMVAERRHRRRRAGSGGGRRAAGRLRDRRSTSVAGRQSPVAGRVSVAERRDAGRRERNGGRRASGRCVGGALTALRWPCARAARVAARFLSLAIAPSCARRSAAPTSTARGRRGRARSWRAAKAREHVSLRVARWSRQD
ncbi:hypothetical protein PsYK624_172910 [Phanerochaete sordida]|uniref:Uncharacterized protein n=1 Tax=Phanerochaete sordida TaxID=48140 RepID=A0A9P3GT98_9APHY|nr:hypothetical protein PsYK624_172910 [Phanerochaete sordida]